MNYKIFESKNVIINVTNFDAMSPDDPLGYLSSCNVMIMSDGNIVMFGNECKESFLAKDICSFSDNINNYDPLFEKDCKIILKDKEIRLSFADINIKSKFAQCLKSLY